MQVVLFIISARGDFDILSQVEEISIEKRTTLPTWVPDWTSPYGPISQLTFRKRFAGARKTETPVALIGTPPLLGLIGAFEGTIEFVLDSQPPTVDLEAIIERVLQRTGNPNYMAENDISQVHILLHAQLRTWLHEQGVAPSALSRIIPSSYYHSRPTRSNAPRSWQLRWDLWMWIETHAPSHLSKSPPSMPRIDPRTITHDVDLVTALMLIMTDKSQVAAFPGKKIAVLKDKSLLLVPSCAQAGDAVWSFCPGPGHWVLRMIQPENYAQLSADLLTHFQRVQKSLDAKLPLELDDSIPEWSPPWEGHVNAPHYKVRHAVEDLSLDTGLVEHANYIGECFPGPFAYNSWAFEFVRGYRPLPREEPTCNAQIVALH
jgi:hypothetical protein